MGVQVSTRVDVRDLDAFAGGLDKLAVAMAADSGRTQRAATLAAEELVGYVRQTIMDSHTASRFAGVRTGALARSFKPATKVDRTGFSLAAVSDSVYAQIQDEGGTIRPRTVRALAIPLTAWAARQWPRDVPRGVLFRRGNALSRRIGKRKIVNEYALAKSVRIHGKQYGRTAVQEAAPMVARILLDELVIGGLDGI